MLVALLACVTLFGQSPAPVTEIQTFQVRGTIRAFNDSAVRGAEVTFQSQKTSITVSSDSSGFYEANLPDGLYTMTAKPVAIPAKVSTPFIPLGIANKAHF